MARDLFEGCVGPDVREVQRALSKRLHHQGVRLVPDHRFGPKTAGAVRRFQQRHGLKVDGIVGRRTRPKLFPMAGYTVKLWGKRHLLAEYKRHEPNFRPTLSPGNLTLGNSLAPVAPLPLISYSKQSIPGLPLPITTPVFDAPKSEGPKRGPSAFANPFDHFEAEADSSVPLLGRPRKIDFDFDLTLSGVVIIGEEDKFLHGEYSTGFGAGNPTAFNKETWDFYWFSQYSWILQKQLAGDFEWSANAQVAAQIDLGLAPRPSIRAYVSPVNLAWKAIGNLKLQIGGPQCEFDLDFNSGSLHCKGLNFGAVYEFGGK